MTKIKLDIIAGTRPNFVKIAALYSALKNSIDLQKIFELRLIHTGQHYDFNMSGVFFDQLGLPKPDFDFGLGGKSQAEQVGSIMLAYEQLLASYKPDFCLVFGDVNSTLACAITAKKMHIQVAHIEAGIRSGDRKMPEEINRLLVDSISDIFFTTSESASHNLHSSGVKPSNVHFVGNTMIDTLLNNLDHLRQPDIIKEPNLKYFIATLHRPSNVDNVSYLRELLEKLSDAIGACKLIIPLHPRTKNNLGSNYEIPNNIVLTDSLPYLEFLWLIRNSVGVITDSGGVTEEATVLSVPCITLRANTERPETVDLGTNILVGSDFNLLKKCILDIQNKKWKKSVIPPFWDGKAAERIYEVLKNNSISS
jgi:UDP-N-acetylglucosamine 2-epimerase (non-hydrolysing)